MADDGGEAVGGDGAGGGEQAGQEAGLSEEVDEPEAPPAVRIRSALRLPPAWAIIMMSIVQLAPRARVVSLQSLTATKKSAGLVPVSSVRIVPAVVPVLVTVSVLIGLEIPNGTCPKSSGAGSACNETLPGVVVVVVTRGGRVVVGVPPSTKIVVVVVPGWVVVVDDRPISGAAAEIGS